MSEIELGWSDVARQTMTAADAMRRALSVPHATARPSPVGDVPTPVCRSCGRPLRHDDALCDLGALPLANALLDEDSLDKPEVHYPLRPLVCRGCLLVQLPAVLPPERVFADNYPFYAGQSATWLAHCKEFARTAKQRFGLGPTSRVLDIGSNDGSMLRPFRGMGIPALGVEPCAGVAQHALMEGLTTVVDWWGTRCAERLLATGGEPTASGGWRADLVVATNVLAHVPDLLDFLVGVRMILRPGGTTVFEVPYVGNLIREGQFDQIYAEHHCYFSLTSLGVALEHAGLAAYDVEPLPTHGGSLRVYAHVAGETPTTGHWRQAFHEEREAGLHEVDTYLAFADVPPQAKRVAWRRLAEFEVASALGKVVGYGASAKAAVALNYFGMGPETIEFIADTTPAKWGKYLSGVRIPIRGPQQLEEAQPDVVVLLAWNWAEEAVPKIRAACPGAEIVTLNGYRVP